MLKKFVQQLKVNRFKSQPSMASEPYEMSVDGAKSSFLKRLSKHALDLYVKKTDIRNFTKLALSNPEDTSHNDLVNDLHLSEDPFDELHIKDLSDNENFLKDLGL